MFPERTDRIVLDSNIGDTHLDRNGLRRHALGMEQTLPDFAQWAARRHDSYGLGRTPQQVRASYLTIAGRLDKAPVAGIARPPGSPPDAPFADRSHCPPGHHPDPVTHRCAVEGTRRRKPLPGPAV
ncbi:hypothetical protein GCM10022384_66720 [Streptomyces marokkonensis]|uniref:Uncharacterized protein n=1 Tax=Streptomyces marokkonensis TaxID=324855 RepID=A0ABP7SKE3_9ACTN